jgi:hypothetical protein
MNNWLECLMGDLLEVSNRSVSFIYSQITRSMLYIVLRWGIVLDSASIGNAYRFVHAPRACEHFGECALRDRALSSSAVRPENHLPPLN